MFANIEKILYREKFLSALSYSITDPYDTLHWECPRCSKLNSMSQVFPIKERTYTKTDGTTYQRLYVISNGVAYKLLTEREELEGLNAQSFAERVRFSAPDYKATDKDGVEFKAPHCWLISYQEQDFTFG